MVKQKVEIQTYQLNKIFTLIMRRNEIPSGCCVICVTVQHRTFVPRIMETPAYWAILHLFLPFANKDLDKSHTGDTYYTQGLGLLPLRCLNFGSTGNNL